MLRRLISSTVSTFIRTSFMHLAMLPFGSCCNWLRLVAPGHLPRRMYNTTLIIPGSGCLPRLRAPCLFMAHSMAWSSYCQTRSGMKRDRLLCPSRPSRIFFRFPSSSNTIIFRTSCTRSRYATVFVPPPARETGCLSGAAITCTESNSRSFFGSTMKRRFSNARLKISANTAASAR